MINALGTELCKIYADTSLPNEGKQAAWTMLEQATPYLLKFLANEYDDTSAGVFPFVNDMLYIVSTQYLLKMLFSNVIHTVQETKEANASILTGSA